MQKTMKNIIRISLACFLVLSCLTTVVLAQSSLVGVKYQVHVQDMGWQAAVADGATAGTIGMSLRSEAFKINLTNAPEGAKIVYQAHVQDVGWMSSVSNGALAGTTGQSLRVEALKISLKNLPGYSVEYRVHVQTLGWLDWVKDGAIAGTTTQSLRLEAVEIRMVKLTPVSTVSITGSARVGSTLTAGFSGQTPTVNYQWQSSADGITYSDISGATGKTYTIPLGSANMFYKVTATGTDYYTGKVASASTAKVTKAYPTITVNPTSLTLTYGQTLTNRMLANGIASVAGTFSFNEDHGIMDAGTYSLGWTFYPTDSKNYNTLTGNVSVKVEKRSITVLTTGTDKIYDGTVVAAVTLDSYKLAGDIFTLSYTSASFADKNVGQGKIVTVTGISISGTDAGNYNLLNTTAVTTAGITARDLTVTAAGIDKVYNGRTTAAVTLASNKVAGDALTLKYTGAYFADKNIGEDKVVTAAGISISGTTAGNYKLLNTTAGTTADITARDLTVTATGIDKVYDGTAAAEVTLVSNKVVGDTIALNYTYASFEDKNVDTDKAVTAANISISDTDAGNYNLINTTAETTADITARDLTVTAAGIDKVYDGNTDAAVTLTSDMVAGDVLSLSYESASFADKNVGEGKAVTAAEISISDTDAGNYNLVNTTADTTADITARDLIVTAEGIDKVYDGTTAAEVTLTSDMVAEDILTLSYASASFADKNVGEDKAVTAAGISISGTDAGNYNFLNTTADTTADITARDLTVTAAGIDKVYDGSTAAEVTLTSDMVAGDVLTLSYESASFADKNVGEDKVVTATGISISDTDAGNYNLLNVTATTTADITARDLTVTAEGIDKVYDGSTAAEVTLTSDMVAGDVLTLSYASASFADKNVGEGKAVTTEEISISNTDAGNYNLLNTTADTTADITARDLTVTAAGIDKVYDGNTDAAVTLTSDMVAGDVLTLSYASASFADKNVGEDKAVTAAEISISGTDAGNYNLMNSTADTTADITVRDLTVTAVGIHKVYDATTVAEVTLASDMIDGDILSLSYESASFADKNVGEGKAVTAMGISISGTDAGNYNLVSTAADTTADITARELIVTAASVDKTYDGTTAAEVTLASNMIAGDILTLSCESASFEDKNVGEGKAVTVAGISISGTDSGNYTVNTTAGTTAAIKVRPITVTADPMSKTYGDNDPVITFELSENLRNGDSFTGSLSRAAGNNVAEYAINQGTLSAGTNYNITFVPASFTIDKKDLTITAVDMEKYYGDADSSLTAEYSDFAYDDTASRLNGTLVLNRAEGENAGRYEIYATGLTSGNYHIIYQAGNLTILPRPITILSTSADKVYDGTTLTIYKSELDSSGSLLSLRSGDDLVTVTTTGYQKNVGSSANTPSGAVIMRGETNVTANYAITYATGTLTVTKRPVTITANSSTGTYNGTGKSVSGWTLTGGTLAASQVLTANAGAVGTNAGSYNTTISNIKIMAGADVVTGNYDITTVQGALTINQLPITIIGTDATKMFDGTILVDHTSVLSAGTPVASGDELITVTTTGYQKNVGHSENTPSGAIILRGTDVVTDNYAITYTPGTLTVTARPITITADSMTKTVSQADPTFTYTLSEPLRNGDSITGSLSRDAGNTVGNYTIRLGTLTAGTNYTITYVPGTLTLIKGTQTLALSAATLSGNAGTTIALSASAPGAGNVTYAVTSGTSIGASVSSSGVVTLGTAGTVTVTASKAECANYYSASNSITVTSNPVAPTITAFTASKAGSFDGNNRDLATFTPTVYNPSGSGYPVSYTYSISKTGEHGSIDYAGGGANTARLAVGTYKITCTATNSVGSDSEDCYLEIPQTSTSVGQAAEGLTSQTVQLVFSGNGSVVTSYNFDVYTAGGHNGGGGDSWSVIGYTGVNMSGYSQTLANGSASTGVNVSNSIPVASSIKSVVFSYRVADGHGAGCLSSNVSYSVGSLIPYNDIDLVNAVAPILTTALTNPSTQIDTAVTLDATATATDGGTISYQWYSNTSASTIGGTVLTGSRSATYLPAVNTVGTFYYYCVVTNTNAAATGAKTASITEVSTVTVYLTLVDAAAPVITTTLVNPTTTVGIAVTLDATATVTDVGTVSYEWYSNTTASVLEGTPLGVTTASYDPAVDTAGTSYYYCVVTNNNSAATGAKIAKTSGLFTVTVNEPAVVDALNLSTLVTAPVKGATPSTAAIEAVQYTGTIAWFEADGTTPVTGDFAASTVYTAKVTLTAEAGYTLTGVGANTFTYEGSTSAANAADAGVVTITFPATAAAEITAFDAIPNVDAGTEGYAAYADAAAVQDVLAETVTGNTGAVTVPVTAWVDTDTYNPAIAGSYTFTATLGEVPAGYANTAGLTATVEVVVSSAPVIESVGYINELGYARHVRVTGTDFKADIMDSDFTIDLGTTGWTYSLSFVSSNEVIVTLTGDLATAQDVTIQANTSAYSPVSTAPSNILTVTFGPV